MQTMTPTVKLTEYAFYFIFRRTPQFFDFELFKESIQKSEMFLGFINAWLPLFERVMADTAMTADERKDFQQRVDDCLERLCKPLNPPKRKRK